MAETIPAGDVIRHLMPALLEATRSYVGLVALNADGRAVAKGSAALALIDGRKVLVTASHVAQADLLAANEVVIHTRPEVIEEGVVTGPVMFDGRDCKLIWTSPTLDVAVLAASPQLAASTTLRFLDADASVAATRGIRARLRQVRTDETTFAFFVFGFPNFGHLDLETGQELLSALPLPADVTQLDEQPWTGFGQTPQMVAQIEGTEADGPGDQAELRRRLFDGLTAPTAGAKEPVGGYSGGPIGVVAANGLFWIAVIKEGGEMFGRLSIFATPWDDAIAALRASNEWQAFIGTPA